MIGASKILTVSYGTFSCTLEGFDEPFSTMKAIAEYFRDLAAEDRYFGAEPPTPDAAMLHRIAEREIQRRVEAKIQDNGVILRAGDEGEPMAPALAAPAPALDTPVAAGESAAEKLRRLRAEAGPVAAPVAAVAASAVVHAAEINDTYAEDISTPVGFAPDVAADADVDVPQDDAGDLPGADFGYDVALAPQAADGGYDAQFEEDLEEPALTASALLETFDTEAPAPQEDDVLAALAAALPEEMADDLDGDDAMLAALMDEPAEVAAAVVADDFDADDFAEDEDDTTAMLAALVDPLPEDRSEGADDQAAIGTLIDPMGTADAFDDAAPETGAEDDETGTGTEAIEAAELVAPAPAPAPANEKAHRARARVIRIRRNDAAAPDAAPAPAPVATAPAAPLPPRASLLSAEAEAALQAELAALEAEIGGDLTEAVAQDSAEDLAADATPRADGEPRRRLDAGTDDSVSRLIAQTNTEMDGEDTRRRRSAIAHLKAAVVATSAERQIQGPAPERSEERKEPYRADLEQAVRPRRTEGDRLSPLVLVSEQRIDRPRATTSTAALHVATSTAPEAAPTEPGRVMPVRPRRVKSGGGAATAAQSLAEMPAQMAANSPAAILAEVIAPEPPRQVYDAEIVDDGDDEDEADDGNNIFSDGDSFGDFADRLGATQLPDLLEAAAVYCAMILKRPEFSRPLVLRQVSELPGGAGLGREDCLRSFGHLLRKGRITKVRAGHFAVTERSPILAEALRIAG